MGSESPEYGDISEEWVPPDVPRRADPPRVREVVPWHVARLVKSYLPRDTWYYWRQALPWVGDALADNEDELGWPHAHNCVVSTHEGLLWWPPYFQGSEYHQEPEWPLLIPAGFPMHDRSWGWNHQVWSNVTMEDGEVYTLPTEFQVVMRHQQVQWMEEWGWRHLPWREGTPELVRKAEEKAVKEGIKIRPRLTILGQGSQQLRDLGARGQGVGDDAQMLATNLDSSVSSWQV